MEEMVHLQRFDCCECNNESTSHHIDGILSANQTPLDPRLLEKKLSEHFHKWNLATRFKIIKIILS